MIIKVLFSIVLHNQRTKGPVTLTFHLVPGRHRDFAHHNFKHVYSPTACAYNHLLQAFIIPIILYQFQKDPFCLIILYKIFRGYYMATVVLPGISARGPIWSAGPICLVTRRWTCFKLFITCFFMTKTICSMVNSSVNKTCFDASEVLGLT